jgi:regulator of extracellular matrix RemA (YlzA/DUF370 family)
MGDYNEPVAHKQAGHKAAVAVLLVHMGFGTYLAANRALVVLRPGSEPVRRLLLEADKRGQLIDATYGRRTKAIVVLDTGHVVLCALQPETIASRLRRQLGQADDGGE